MTDQAAEIRRRVSYHEAAHGVAGGWCMAKKLLRVSIVPAADRSWLGQCEFAPDEVTQSDGQTERGNIEAKAITFLAGPLGEAHAMGSLSLVTSEPDFRAALDCCLFLSGGSSEERAVALRQEYRGIALHILLQHWPVVDAVANALLQGSGTLDGQQFRAICASAQMAPINTPPPVPPSRAAGR